MRGRARVMTRDECLERLSSHGVGRVSASRHALPIVVPVDYRKERSSIIFGAPLEPGFGTLCHNTVIAFETDGHGNPDGVRWSVQIQGIARLLQGNSDDVEQSRIDIDRISGKSRVDK